MKVEVSRGRFAAIGVLVALCAAALVIAWGTGSGNDSRRVGLTEKLCRAGVTVALPQHASRFRSIDRFRTGTISVRLELCQTTGVSGRPLKALLVFDNHDHFALAIRECPDQWVFAGVVRGQFTSVPGVLSNFCRTNGPPFVPPGVSYMTIELPTFSSGCDRGATVTYQGTPPCTKREGWPPALPLGRYRTSVEVMGLPIRSPMLRSLEVSLVGCGAVKDCACSPVGERIVNGHWVPFC